MLIGIWAFAFAALGFAYFYLRSANNASLWRPAHVTAPTGVGAAVFAFSLASAFLVAYGLGRFRSGSELDWQVAGWTGVLCTLTAVALQIWQLTVLPFFPGSSGYASCFVGWAGMNIALLLSGGILARNPAGTTASPSPCRGRGRGHDPFRPPCRPALPGESRGMHLLLGIHRLSGTVLLDDVLRGLRPGELATPRGAAAYLGGKGGQ